MLYALVFFYFEAFVLSESVIGCGGFVRFSPLFNVSQAQQVDLTKLKLSMYNKGESLIYSMECAPSGFFYSF